MRSLGFTPSALAMLDQGLQNDLAGGFGILKGPHMATGFGRKRLPGPGGPSTAFRIDAPENGAGSMGCDTISLKRGTWRWHLALNPPLR
jgi:hypothetical protein